MTSRILPALAALLTVFLLPATVHAQNAVVQWRKAAWSMRTLAPPDASLKTVRVRWGEPAFVQPVALAETAVIARDVEITIAGMPMAKAPTALKFSAGARFHRVETTEAGRRIYCGADSGYSAKSTMVRIQSRLCLADDDDDDDVFDRLMLASISRPVDGVPPLSPVYLLGLDNPSYQPLVVSDDARHAVSIPYTRTRFDTRQFFVGPVLFRQGKSFAAGLMLTDSDRRGTATILFDPAADGIPGAKGMPATLVKRPQFKHMRPIRLDSLPATVGLAGATLIIRAVDADGAEIEVARDFSGQTVAVAFSGIVADAP